MLCMFNVDIVRLGKPSDGEVNIQNRKKSRVVEKKREPVQVVIEPNESSFGLYYGERMYHGPFSKDNLTLNVRADDRDEQESPEVVIRKALMNPKTSHKFALEFYSDQESVDLAARIKDATVMVEIFRIKLERVKTDGGFDKIWASLTHFYSAAVQRTMQQRTLVQQYEASVDLLNRELETFESRREELPQLLTESFVNHFNRTRLHNEDEDVGSDDDDEDIDPQSDWEKEKEEEEVEMEKTSRASSGKRRRPLQDREEGHQHQQEEEQQLHTQVLNTMELSSSGDEEDGNDHLAFTATLKKKEDAETIPKYKQELATRNRYVRQTRHFQLNPSKKVKKEPAWKVELMKDMPGGPLLDPTMSQTPLQATVSQTPRVGGTLEAANSAFLRHGEVATVRKLPLTDIDIRKDIKLLELGWAKRRSRKMNKNMPIFVDILNRSRRVVSLGDIQTGEIFPAWSHASYEGLKAFSKRKYQEYLHEVLRKNNRK